jgi:hypothetical protein
MLKFIDLLYDFFDEKGIKKTASISVPISLDLKCFLKDINKAFPERKATNLRFAK